LHTGKPIENIAKDTDRDFFMSAAESRDYGLVDEVVKSRRDGEKKPEKAA
jgi:ATP-dependent Clp protease protease subunit